MTLEQRNRVRFFFAIGLTLLCGLTVLFRMRLAPMAEQLVATQVDNQASDAINNAIAEEITAGHIDYESIVTVCTDEGGNVTTIRTDMESMNRLKTTLLKRIDATLENLSMEQLSVPIGSVILPELFSGRGPNIPVRVLAVRTSDADFRSAFSEAGINQTLHSIYVDVGVEITVLTWTGTQSVSVESSVLVAQTVIVGSVPAAYFNMEG